MQPDEVKDAHNQLLFGGDSYLCRTVPEMRRFRDQCQACTAILMRREELKVFLSYAQKRLEQKQSARRDAPGVPRGVDAVARAVSVAEGQQPAARRTTGST